MLNPDKYVDWWAHNGPAIRFGAIILFFYELELLIDGLC